MWIWGCSLGHVYSTLGISLNSLLNNYHTTCCIEGHLPRQIHHLSDATINKTSHDRWYCLLHARSPGRTAWHIRSYYKPLANQTRGINVSWVPRHVTHIWPKVILIRFNSIQLYLSLIRFNSIHIPRFVKVKCASSIWLKYLSHTFREVIYTDV